MTTYKDKNGVVTIDPEVLEKIKPTPKKRGAYGKRKKTYYWSHKAQRLTSEQYLEKLCDMLEDPLDAMYQMDGNMMLTDYHELISGLHHIRNRNEKPSRG